MVEKPFCITEKRDMQYYLRMNKFLYLLITIKTLIIHCMQFSEQIHRLVDKGNKLKFGS